MLGLVENLGLHGVVLAIAKVYVGMLAATILFIATNAGVIGASRITYSMASHRQLPEIFRRLHPKLKTPWLALIVFGGDRADDLPALRQGRLSRPHVRVRRDALVHDRARLGDRLRVKATRRGAGVARAAEHPVPRASSWPLFAIVGGLGTGAAWLVVVVQDGPTRYAGLAWLAAGFIFYVLYRRRLRLPLAATMRAPVPLGPALALEYRSILVPIVAGAASNEAVEVAARLATERAGRIVLLRVIVVPLELPLDADLSDRARRGDTSCSTRRARSPSPTAFARSSASSARGNAGRAIVEEAERRGSEIIVLGAPRGHAPRNLRPHGRLRPEARSLPRDGRRRQEGRVSDRRRGA